MEMLMKKDPWFVAVSYIPEGSLESSRSQKKFTSGGCDFSKVEQ